ncbi:MAG: hypothetical protein IV088_25130 [Hydrogenophaga sp.]|nr:hypothetical protein [Hydrogenophaga sp.]MBT9554139.1 hypothetical protein [Hydrogenophaga sp.]
MIPDRLFLKASEMVALIGPNGAGKRCSLMVRSWHLACQGVCAQAAAIE